MSRSPVVGRSTSPSNARSSRSVLSWYCGRARRFPLARTGVVADAALVNHEEPPFDLAEPKGADEAVIVLANPCCSAVGAGHPGKHLSVSKCRFNAVTVNSWLQIGHATVSEGLSCRCLFIVLIETLAGFCADPSWLSIATIPFSSITFPASSSSSSSSSVKGDDFEPAARPDRGCTSVLVRFERRGGVLSSSAWPSRPLAMGDAKLLLEACSLACRGCV